MDGYTKMASLVGIIVGMIFFSCVADSLGRRLGSCLTNVLMLVGAIMLTAASPGWANLIFFSYSLADLIFFSF